jgi:hypothetical protein
MAIRLRRVNGILVALCAAKSVAKEGDIYLDDEQHMAIAEKFWEDYGEDFMVPIETHIASDLIRLFEESNNENAEQWDQMYGPEQT